MASKIRTYGLLAGLGTVLYLLFFYFADRALFLNGGVTWSSLFIYFIFMYKAVTEKRTALGGRINFREAAQPAFTVYVFANFIYYTFIYLMFNYFDPALTDLQRDLMAQSGIDTKGLDLKMTLPLTFYTFAQSLIPGFAFSALLATILKR